MDLQEIRSATLTLVADPKSEHILFGKGFFDKPYIMDGLTIRGWYLK
jgi:hypothetical protein